MVREPRHPTERLRTLQGEGLVFILGVSEDVLDLQTDGTSENVTSGQYLGVQPSA